MEVVSGQGGGLSVATANDGGFRIYGVAGDIALRVSKDGYQTNTQVLAVTDHMQAGSLGLALVRPRMEVSGSYTLTLTADPGCATALPDELRTRRYSALVTQAGPLVEVRLSGPTFALSRAGGGDHFTGRVEPNQLVFDLRHYDAYYYGFYGDMFYADIFEELSATSYLEIWGRVLAVGTSGSLSGPLDGAFEQYASDPRAKRYQTQTARCRSGGNRFELSR